MMSPWPNTCWKCALTSRAMPAVALPAGNGTIARICLAGVQSACAADTARTKLNSKPNLRILVLTPVPKSTALLLRQAGQGNDNLPALQVALHAVGEFRRRPR